MKKLFFIFLMLAFACTTSVKKNSWTIGEKYLQKNGQDIFLSGVNYIPSHGWLTILMQDWSPIEIDNKFIEIYHKIKDGKQISLLLNHVDRNENVTIASAKSIKLSDFITGKSKGNGERISFKIGAGVYRILAFE